MSKEKEISIFGDTYTIEGTNDYNELINKPDLSVYSTKTETEQAIEATKTLLEGEVATKADKDTTEQAIDDLRAICERKVDNETYEQDLARLEDEIKDKVDSEDLCTINGQRLDTGLDIAVPSTDYVDTSVANLKTYTDTELAKKADVTAIPTKTSQLTNDSDFTTMSAV